MAGYQTNRLLKLVGLGDQRAMTVTKRLREIMVHLASRIRTSSPSSAFDSATGKRDQAATDRDIVRKDIMALPTFDELPKYKNFAGCAWGVWGPNDQLGTVNLLTDEVVQRAAAEEIKFVWVLCDLLYGADGLFEL